MKKWKKIILSILFIFILIICGVYWAFFDIQRIDGQEVLSENSSPNGNNIITVYLNNGGATTDYAILCSVKKQHSEKERNIYWKYHCTDAKIQWLDDDTAIINGITLDVWKDTYDYRHD